MSIKRLLAVLSILALSPGCETRAEREAAFDGQLRAMAGSPEAGLLGSMGRIPDNTYQLEDGTKILQWRWDTSYIDPGMPPIYQRFGGGAGAAACGSRWVASRRPWCDRAASSNGRWCRAGRRAFAGRAPAARR